MKRQIIFILIFFACTDLAGQSFRNLRIKSIYLSGDSIQLDSMLILPETVKVFHNNKEIDKSWYSIDVGKGLFVPLKDLKNHKDSILVRYRIFPYNVLQPVSQRSISQYKTGSNFRLRTDRSSKRNLQRSGILMADGLNKQGNYTRGISYGNNQDVVVNSNLNLQLSGKLSNEINILAAISDNNVPIQPDGNTQTIQDFDRIFIQLYDKTKELTLGDYEIESPTGHYMRFYKKVQGGRFSGSIVKKDKTKPELASVVSASIAKGKFNRLEIQGLEGVQGPYRLTGVNKEMYIVVLAGSEKVFVDGKRLKRGEQNEYVINYNTAELSFTTSQPINQNSRIVVEFEYSEENYSRYLLFNGNELKLRNGKIWLNVYHEQDSKTQAIDQSLSDENKMLLSQVGDNLSLAQVSNVEKVEYSNDYVLYRKVKQTIDGVEYEVYEYSTDPEEAFYRVVFSFVGAGNGNYQQVRSSANGRVYQWLAPVNGVLQGNYEPVVQLIAPQKQQMFTAGADLKWGKGVKSTFEFALSNRDLNTFSSLDDKDNQGMALDFLLEKKTVFSDSLKNLHTSFRFHHIQEQFKELEPFRSVEFFRDWNISSELEKRSENYYALNNSFSNASWGNVGYEFSILRKKSAYQGTKHAVNFLYEKKKLSILFAGNSLFTNQDDLETRFIRHRMNAAYIFKFVRLGVETETENNQWDNKNNGELLANSFSFHSYKFYVENSDSTANQFQTYYQSRINYRPQQGDLKSQSKSQDFGAKIWLKKNRRNQLKLESVYRKFSVLNNFVTNEKPENTFLGKLEHQARIKKGLLQSSTYYELGSGLESEKEYSYVEVNSGQGVYRWTDYNNNEVKELDEFELASFRDEADYIRVATNTTRYQKVYTSEFRQTFYLRLQNLKAKKAFGSFFTRFKNRFAYRIAKKSLEDDFKLYANPFKSYSDNENVITIASGFQNTLSYQKKRAKTSWDLIHISNTSKQLLTQGVEKQKFSQNGIRFNWKFGDFGQLSNRIDQSRKNLYSESFAAKNYRLDQLKNELKLKFQPSLVFQFGINYTATAKKNDLGAEKSLVHKLGADCQYTMLKKGKLTGSVNFLNVDYNSDSNTSVAYEMMEGFLPGKNATWSLGYNQQMSKIFQISFSYNGRQSERGKTTHVGSMELRAYF